MIILKEPMMIPKIEDRDDLIAITTYSDLEELPQSLKKISPKRY